ncbi:hypothetical protein BDY17DRAFT_290537 [Neohortaea acidophila]|uniref:Uncharacterized protein n=1 Tax=Neohortaea acidophila TaxID=245834 RepID=A0A6A6Q1P9_9PEZI|nr:uncharacterized protein BDY17DRAFT_290537 [Neohortaea acidophila]KAF2485916.1 hypothetical protein BDY17DRAFT_290537 [Neohortaea acidophila]
MGDQYPAAPMAPGTGPFPDAPMGQPNQMHEYYPAQGQQFDQQYAQQHYDNQQYGNQHGVYHNQNYNMYDGKPKKNNKIGNRVGTRYEGYTLERKHPDSKHPDAWASVIPTPMHLDQKELRFAIKRHKAYGGSLGVQADLQKLTTIQQGAVNHFIGERMRGERDRYAQWVLADVQGVKRGLFSRELQRIEVILRCDDKNAKKDSDRKGSKGGKKKPTTFEIVDREELNRKKALKGNGKIRKSRSDNDLYAWGNEGGYNSNNFQQIPVPPHMPQWQQFPQQDQYPQQGQVPDPFPHQQQMQGGVYYGPDNYQPGPPQFHHQQEPQYGVADPFPPQDDAYYPDDQQARPRARQHRASSSRPKTERRVSALEDQMDYMAQKMEQFRISGGNSSEDATTSYETASIFSSPPPRRHRSARTPDARVDGSDLSSPTEYSPGSSLERSRKPHRSRYRGGRHREWEVVPAYSARNEWGLPVERRRSTRGEAGSRRPKLHHAATYDDYPSGRATDGSSRPRRLTDAADDRYDFENERRRPRLDYDALDEGGRREYGSTRYRHRSSVAGLGGSRRYYD